MKEYISLGVSIASVALVLIMVRHGYRERLFAASALFLRLFVSFVLAMTFCRPVELLIRWVFTGATKYMISRLVFLGILWGSYLLMTELYERWMEPDHVHVPNAIDRAGGMVFGGAAGAVLVGLFLLTWAFLPLARLVGPLPLDETKLPVDMGKVLVQEYAHLSMRMKTSAVFDSDSEVQAYRELDEQVYPAAGTPTPPSPQKTEGAGGPPPPAPPPPKK
jgi:hypothetical protein